MIGQTISRYKILAKLGEGGMGIVYKAEDLKLKRTVALKFLPRQIRSNVEDRKRFEVEAQAAAALNHPLIAQIYSIEESDDEMFIVMEYLEGQTLHARIKAEIPDPQSALAYATQIARALEAAHARGIVHRDIKSSNIMITPDGSVKIMDFGLAKMTTATQLTKVGSTLGTAAYMSPEQVQGKDADQRSDIWSYGVVLYELLTGTLPFGGTYSQAVFYSILNQPPPPLPLNPQTFPGFPSVITKCLEKDPSSRFQSFSEVLGTFGGSGVPSVKGRVGGKWGISLGWPHISAGIVILTLAGLLILGPGKVKSWVGFASIPNEQHLVVLPFTSIGGDSTRQPLCDGLVETITSKLTQLEQFHGSLWVVPTSEVRRYNTQSPGEAYQSFGANLVVTGNLQLIQDVFRLTMNLVDAQQVRQLNSTVIDIKEADLASLQDQSITRLLDMLDFELSPQSQTVIQAGGTSIARANEEYLQGLGYLLRYDVSSNVESAIDHFRHSIEQDEHYALAFSGLGEASWRKYEATKENNLARLAVENCERAYALDPKLPRVNIALGLVHAGTGNNERAVEDFRRALDLDPGNDAAYRGLAKAHEAGGNPEEAEAIYQRAIQLKPSFWAGYYDLGTFYFRRARYDDGLKQFLEVIRLTPDNFRAYSNVGGMYYMLNRLPEARSMFERSLEIKKSYVAASNLATLYYVQGEYTKSARTYEEALKLNDQDYQVWGNLGSAYYWSEGEREKSKIAFHRAADGAEQSLKVNPRDAETIAKLAGYYAVLKEKKKAEDLVEKALKLDVKNSSIMYLAGTTYEQLGKREKALYWIGRALEYGYSLSEIEQQPELRQLLADKRFADVKKKYRHSQ